MGRKIYVSSDMSVDERLIDVAATDPLATLLWPWILTKFDDWGRAEASPKRLKAAVFPMISSVTVEEIDAAIRLYAEAGLITRYELDGREYMAIPPEKWFKYQTHIRKEKRENDGSRFPPPPDYTHERGDVCKCAQSSTTDSNCTPSPSPSPSLSDDVDDDASSGATAGQPEEDKPKSECLSLINRSRPDWPLSGERYREFLDYEDRLPWTVIRKAVDRSLAAGARDLKYCLRILEHYVEHNVRTVADVEALDAEFEAAKSRRNRASPSGPGTRRSNVILQRDRSKAAGDHEWLYSRFEPGPHPSGSDEPP